MLAPLVLLGWLLLGSSLLAVRDVTVTGASRLTVAQVRAAAAVPVGTALARVDTAAVARRIRALPPVARVEVRRSWPHGLRLLVTERVPVAVIADGAQVLLLDATGTVVGPAPKTPPGLLILHVPSSAGPVASAALAVLRDLPAALRAQVAGLSAATSDQVELQLRDGRRVVWGSPVDGARKAAATQVLLRLPGRVFDVSSPGVVTRR